MPVLNYFIAPLQPLKDIFDLFHQLQKAVDNNFIVFSLCSDNVLTIHSLRDVTVLYIWVYC